MPFAPEPVKPVRPARPTRLPKASSTARGYGREHRRLRQQVIQEQQGICAWCHDKFATDLHHIDHDNQNTARGNLVGLCEGCHHGIAHGRSK